MVDVVSKTMNKKYIKTIQDNQLNPRQSVTQRLFTSGYTNKSFYKQIYTRVIAYFSMLALLDRPALPPLAAPLLFFVGGLRFAQPPRFEMPSSSAAGEVRLAPVRGMGG